MSTKEINAAVRKIKALQRKADILDDEIEKLKSEVKAEMMALGVSELTAGTYKVKYTSVVTERFDTKAFKTSHEDIYRMYAKPVESMRLTIT